MSELRLWCAPRGAAAVAEAMDFHLDMAEAKKKRVKLTFRSEAADASASGAAATTAVAQLGQSTQSSLMPPPPARHPAPGMAPGGDGAAGAVVSALASDKSDEAASPPSAEASPRGADAFGDEPASPRRRATTGGGFGGLAMPTARSAAVKPKARRATLAMPSARPAARKSRASMAVPPSSNGAMGMAIGVAEPGDGETGQAVAGDKSAAAAGARNGDDGGEAPASDGDMSDAGLDEAGDTVGSLALSPPRSPAVQASPRPQASGRRRSAMPGQGGFRALGGLGAPPPPAARKRKSIVVPSDALGPG